MGADENARIVTGVDVDPDVQSVRAKPCLSEVEKSVCDASQCCKRKHAPLRAARLACLLNRTEPRRIHRHIPTLPRIAHCRVQHRRSRAHMPSAARAEAVPQAASRL
jgi:hypothetical protein